MKKIFAVFCIFALSLPIFPTGAVCSTISFFSRGGWILNSADFSVPFFTAGISTHAQSEGIFFDCTGGFLSLSSDYAKAQGDFRSEFLSLAVGIDKFSARLGGFSARFPEEFHIADEKPRFVFEDICFFEGNAGLSYEFTDSFKVDFDFFGGNFRMEKGDLYYFYGKIESPEMYAGFLSARLPYDFKIRMGNLFANLKILTNEEKSLGDGNIHSFVLLGEKGFSVREAHHFSVDLGYLYADFDASVRATNKTQTYALFPYKYAGGKADGSYHIGFFGGKYEYTSRNSDLKIALGGAFCAKSESGAEFEYKYKKSLLFDGSSGGGDFEMPNFEKSVLIGGLVDYSYKIERFSHFTPFFSIQKIVAVPILSEKTKSYFSNDAKKSSDSSASSSFHTQWNLLRIALLSGLSFRIKIELW